VIYVVDVTRSCKLFFKFVSIIFAVLLLLICLWFTFYGPYAEGVRRPSLYQISSR